MLFMWIFWAHWTKLHEDSPKKKEKMPSPKSPITYVRRSMTRSTSSKGKAILQDTQQDLQEAEAVL